MSEGLMFTVAGLTVAALSSVVGIWVQRDENKPPRWAIMLSLLIVLASGVGMAQAWLDNQQAEKMEADMARMLATLDKLVSSGAASPELAEILKTEMKAQARSSPGVMRKVAQRVADDGGDPAAVLGNYISAADVQTLSRDGDIKAATRAPEARAAAEPTRAQREVLKAVEEQVDRVEKAGATSKEEARVMVDDAAKAATKATTNAATEALDDAKADGKAAAKKEVAKAKKAVGGLLGKEPGRR